MVIEPGYRRSVSGFAGCIDPYGATSSEPHGGERETKPLMSGTRMLCVGSSDRGKLRSPEFIPSLATFMCGIVFSLRRVGEF